MFKLEINISEISNAKIAFLAAIFLKLVLEIKFIIERIKVALDLSRRLKEMPRWNCALLW